MNKCYISQLSLLLSITFLFFNSTAHALESVDFVIETSIQSGDAEIITLFSSTDPNKNETIKAGAGPSLLLGANFNLSTSS